MIESASMAGSSASRAIAMPATDARPLVAHVVYRFDVGGLENGVANLVNRLPEERYRHVIVALTDVTDFRQRVLRDDVGFVALHKPPGHGFRLLPRLYRLFSQLDPAIVHTRNLAALEVSSAAWAARVPVRIHGEHGRDVGDLDGSNRTYRLVRRVHRPFVDHYVALSQDLARYLTDDVGVPHARVTHIVNGVDTALFRPASTPAQPEGFPFGDPGLCVFGTVGRLQAVKNQTLLARAFVRALDVEPALRSRMRLVVVGDGPLAPQVVEVLLQANAEHLAWLPGARDDVAALLRAFDVFVLPSLAEGISNTILEAMASGLPVVATRVGGNGELVADGETGTLVPSSSVDALARAMLRYARDVSLVERQGRAGRARAEQRYSIDAMVGHYASLYERLLAGRERRGRTAASTPRAISGNG